MTMGEKILNMRKARGWSQEELAERMGVSRQAVSRWEAGSAKPDAEKIIALCGLFGISSDYLLGLRVEEEQEQEPPAQTEQAPPKIVYIQQEQPRPLIDAKAAGWLLIGVSVLLMVAYFIFAEVSREDMPWLFWLGVGGVFAGVCLAPGAKFCGKKTCRKGLGWTLVVLAFLPLVVFVGYFGLLHGDWEMEIIWPTVTVFLAGLILSRDWKSDRFA